MASEITSGPIRMMGNDVPESSMVKEPQGITRNQDSQSELLKDILQVLQQISKGQVNPQELKKEDTQPASKLQEFLPEVVGQFQTCLSSNNCDELLNMVKQNSAELFLQTIDKEYSRSALHVAILKGSQPLIDALVEKLKVYFGGNISKLVEHEFIQKEDKFGLSVVHMAALIGNEEIISSLSKLGLQFYDHHEFGPPCRSPTSKEVKEDLLQKASDLLTRQAPSSSDQRTISLGKWLQENNVDFVYCLHEAAMNGPHPQNKAYKFVEHVCDTKGVSYLEPLLKVRDSLGRTPLHVLVDYPDCLPLFKKLVEDISTIEWNIPDFSERTPLHWAAAQGNVHLVNFLANKKNKNLNPTYKEAYGIEIKPSTIFNYDGILKVTPLHLAVIHNHVKVVEALLETSKGQKLDVNAVCSRPYTYLDETRKDMTWTPIQLAAYMGHKQILRKLWKDERSYDPGLKNKNKNLEVSERHNKIPALHLATSQFHPAVVNTLVDFGKINVLIEDGDKNTALHHAALHAHGRLQIHANLYDYVSVSHFTSKPPQSWKPSDQDMIKCIGTLMQYGLGMEAKNSNKKTPTLHPSCPESVQSWWVQKIANEEQENKNNLLSAANAISVIAALVATLSFVGPLQPPLGLLDDGNQTWLDGYSQVKHTPIETFLFCNSLSFYFAIAAIMFTMLPSWPIPRDWRAIEVRFAHKCVQVAVLFLFGSIIFVVCAFSAANIAIVPNKRWRYKFLTVISTSLGAFICLTILFLSLMRLLILLSSSENAKKIWKFAIRIILWESDTSPDEEKVT